MRLNGRAAHVCGRLGATIIEDLTGGNLKLPRATVGGTASWLPETGQEPMLTKALMRLRLSRNVSRALVISRQLVYQWSPDIEGFVANDIANAIGAVHLNLGIDSSTFSVS